jgi:hypothetical protein
MAKCMPYVRSRVVQTVAGWNSITTGPTTRRDGGGQYFFPSSPSPSLSELLFSFTLSLA